MGARFTIRRANRNDVAAIAAIEQRVFPDPWPESAFPPLFGRFGYVATVRDTVAGYMFGRIVADEGELLNLAVDIGFRRKGLGRRLVHWFCRQLADNGARAVFLEVRMSNRAARDLYSELGFEEVGRRPGYYSHPAEEALVLRRLLAGGEDSA